MAFHIGWIRPGLIGLALGLLTADVCAERLPIRRYTTADGLPSNRINCIVPDNRGFLWFCTNEGLARFDGVEFVSYSTELGLPRQRVTAFFQARDGSYWVGTPAGLVRFNPHGSRPGPVRPAVAGAGAPRRAGPLFDVVAREGSCPSEQMTSLTEDARGRLLIGTANGVCRVDGSDAGRSLYGLALELPGRTGDDRYVQALAVDASEGVWVGTRSGLFRTEPDGRTTRVALRPDRAPVRVQALLAEADGSVWVATNNGLDLFRVTGGSAHWQRAFTVADGLPPGWLASVLRTSDGDLWISAGRGIAKATTVAGRVSAFAAYSQANGLVGSEVHQLAADGDGNLWAGTEDAGAARIARHGATTFDATDGLPGGVEALVETRSGQVWAIAGEEHFYGWDGRRFTHVRPRFPRSFTHFGWGWNQIAFEDREHAWWVPTSHGVCRYPNGFALAELARTSPAAVYTTRDGLGTDDVFRLFEDSGGDVWIGTASPAENRLVRWRRQTGRVDVVRSSGFPSLERTTPGAFAEDRTGAVWIGWWGGGVSRFARGQLADIGPEAKLPPGDIWDLHLDSRGRLWVATTEGGLARLDDPAASRPVFTTYTRHQGLSTNRLLSITEDRAGRIYVGSGLGVDRLDPRTGEVVHFGANEGLVEGDIRAALTDSRGALWFGSHLGVSRLLPTDDRPRRAPTILLAGVSVRGARWPVSEVGEPRVGPLELQPSQNDVTIDFVSPSFGAGYEPRYQYRLDEAHQEWTVPGHGRRVTYASLSPGRYRFLVRAVSADGTASDQPATVVFTVIAPFWQRGWFLALTSVMVVAAGWGVHRMRIARAVALERVRTRIASDLHDDVGASLSRMAILSEVARRQPEAGDAALVDIAETSRSLVDSMSDIVWSIDPRNDDLSSVLARLRAFAADVIDSSGSRCTFEVSSAAAQLKLGPDQRRHLFLICKEAITNVARHAGCTSARLTVSVVGGQLQVSVSDDGRGLASPLTAMQGRGGRGLENMQARARQMGGQLTVASEPGAGTRLTLIVPRG